ncbi:MAG TPA: DUF2062 domain-containing protein [Polyangiaceae bacterium]|jgi:uncharacterized protein (DUF2062 family)/2-polyprenyl-3-methyl-5-hydroxy-6-metoxy-1,4-benzoquinol methylase
MEPAPIEEASPDTRRVLPPPKFSLWREELRRAWCELRGPGTTPSRAALSVGLGLFIGSLPIFGCHTPLVIGLCLWFQLDAAVAWVTANVSNPFFAPALLAAEVQVGAWLRHGTAIDFRRLGSRDLHVGDVLGCLALGSPVVGAALAVAGALIAYLLVAIAPSSRAPRPPYRLPDGAPPWIAAVERVATRYASPASVVARERTRFHYLRGKLLADPAARAVADVAGDAPAVLGDVLDVGTGRGQVPLLLVELGRARTARGVDWDAAKIGDAQRAAAAGSPSAPAASFVVGDVRTAPFASSDTVLLVDILHYFREDEQDAILDRAAAAVRPGGRIVVRDADASRGWRSFATLVEERVFTFLRFHRGERVRFRPASAIVTRLEAAGMRCAVRPAWGSTPFSNVLVLGTRE